MNDHLYTPVQLETPTVIVTRDGDGYLPCNSMAKNLAKLAGVNRLTEGHRVLIEEEMRFAFEVIEKIAVRPFPHGYAAYQKTRNLKGTFATISVPSVHIQSDA